MARAVSLVVALLLAGLAVAQQRRAVEPAVYRKAPRRQAEGGGPPSQRFALRSPVSVSLRALLPDDLAGLKARPGGRNLGIHRSLSGTAIQYSTDGAKRAMRLTGAWSVTADGARLWRLMLGSDGAAGVRLRFTGFAVGKGRVWVHDGKIANPTKAPYAGRGPWGNGDFWTHTVFSDAVYVEYEPDPALRETDAVPFEIRELSHLWTAPAPQTSELAPVPLAAPCQLDVSCFPEWSATARSTALIIFESGGGSFSCSGTLLNTRNSSFTPYFLTAAHCVDSTSAARTVEAFWFFDSLSCNAGAPDTSRIPSVLGARQVRRLGDFNDSRGDFNLLVLEGVPDGAVFSGWDPDPVALGTQVTGVHHPGGEFKRISFGQTVAEDPYRVSDAYEIVREDDGRTESGSSGSGLFTTPNMLVGVLSFGPALPRGATVCDMNPSYVGYGRFSALYPDVSDYLEEILPPPEGSEDLLESSVAREFSLPAVFSPTLSTDHVYRVEVPANAARLTVNLASSPRAADVDLYVRYGTPPVVERGEVVADFRSENPTGAEQVVIDTASLPALREGTYHIAFVLWTRRTAVDAQVTATVEIAPANAEQPQLGAVVHGASQTAGPVAPGEIVAIYGTRLGPDTGVEARLTETGRLPTLVQGAQVFFNDVPAPLYFVRRDQINAQVPYEVAGLDAVQVRVVYQGLSSDAVAVSVAQSAPGIFMFLDGGSRAIVLNQDGTFNSAANPESRGRVVVLFATGEGLLTPSGATGAPVGNQLPLPIPELPVAVEIGGVRADVLFAGAAPGFVGLLQVNARIPASAAVGGDVPLVLRVGETASPNNVTMSTQ